MHTGFWPINNIQEQLQGSLKTKLIFAVISFVFVNALQAQKVEKYFSPDQLIWFVKTYHPLAQKAGLLPAKAAAARTEVRGAFDPSLEGYANEKNFNQVNYYSLVGGGLSVPTWFGVDLKAGFDQTSGVNLNPENASSPNGLVYAGVSVPLAQNLWIDKRRAALKQAKIYSESTVEERKKYINDLYFGALKQYWSWAEKYNQLFVYQEAVNAANQRFLAVKRSFELGDITGLDTLEALIQVQNLQMNRNQARLEYQNHTLELSNYLWFENNTPLVITDSLVPPKMDSLALQKLLNASVFQNLTMDLVQVHPELRLLRYQMSGLHIDRKLKLESLKPKIYLKYQAINQPVGNDLWANYSSNNFRWGFSASMPLFLRESRGALQAVNIKLQETQLDVEAKALKLENELRMYYNQQVTLYDQVNLYSGTVINYGKMLQGERQKFEAGESSLFLVNSRELYYIQARLKWVELMAKYQISIHGVWWAAGRLHEQW